MSASLLAGVFCAGIFLAGFACLVLRRQLLVMLMGLELMLNAANLALVWGAARLQDPAGLSLALLLLAVAAAEAVVGLSLILALHRQDASSSSEDLRRLAG